MVYTNIGFVKTNHVKIVSSSGTSIFRSFAQTQTTTAGIA